MLRALCSGILLSTFVSVHQSVAQSTTPQTTAQVAGPAPAIPAGSTPPLAPSLAPASADSMPSAAPDLASRQTTPSKYIKQTAVMDTSKPDPAASKKAAKQAAAAPPLVKGDDLGLLSSLAVRGWEGLETLKLSATKTALVGADGKLVVEVQGKPAQLLLEYACTGAVTRRFRLDGRYCEASLFRFASPDGAYGAYSTMRKGSSTVVVRGQGSSEDENSITFFAGNALVYLGSAADGDDETKGMLGHLADQIAPHLSGGPVAPRLIMSLPYMDRVTGSEKYFMGPLSAMRNANIQIVESLRLEDARGAAYAEYSYARPMAERLKLIVAEYPNQATAQNAFASYSATMGSYSRKTLDKSNAQILCKMSDSYLMCGTSNTRVWVISGARRATSPSMLARELVP